MRKITLTLFALATITTAFSSCEAIERCCKGDKGCTKETTEAKASTVCGHCGKTSCSATCTAHEAADSTKKGR